MQWYSQSFSLQLSFPWDQRDPLRSARRLSESKDLCLFCFVQQSSAHCGGDSRGSGDLKREVVFQPPASQLPSKSPVIFAKVSIRSRHSSLAFTPRYIGLLFIFIFVNALQTDQLPISNRFWKIPLWATNTHDCLPLAEHPGRG